MTDTRAGDPGPNHEERVMHDDDKLEAARRALRDRRPPVGSMWRHRKTGTVYVSFGGCVIEATLTPAVIYYADPDGTWWVRPLDEFLDGRFERVDQ